MSQIQNRSYDEIQQNIVDILNQTMPILNDTNKIATSTLEELAYQDEGLTNIQHKLDDIEEKQSIANYYINSMNGWRGYIRNKYNELVSYINPKCKLAIIESNANSSVSAELVQASISIPKLHSALSLQEQEDRLMCELNNGLAELYAKSKVMSNELDNQISKIDDINNRVIQSQESIRQLNDRTRKLIR